MVKLYTNHCPQCNTLRDKLNAARVAYEVCDDMEEMRRAGISYTPVLYADGRMMGMAEAWKWVDTAGGNNEN